MFNYYNETTNIKKLKEFDIINFLNDEYLKLNKSKNIDIYIKLL